MSNQSNQNISELMDGELKKDCSRFLLKRMQTDAQLSNKWDSYHLLRSYLQQNNDAPLVHDLGKQVLKKLASDQTRVDMQPAVHSRISVWLKPIIGSAIAASVAVVAILTVNNQSQLPDRELLDEVAAFHTAEQLTLPPKPVYTRFPSSTPGIQQYIIDSNGSQYWERVPSFYNVEYMQQLEQQLVRQQPVKNFSE